MLINLFYFQFSLFRFALFSNFPIYILFYRLFSFSFRDYETKKHERTDKVSGWVFIDKYPSKSTILLQQREKVYVSDDDDRYWKKMGGEKMKSGEFDVHMARQDEKVPPRRNVVMSSWFERGSVRDLRLLCAL